RVAMIKIVKILDANLHGSLPSMIRQQVTLLGDAEWPKVADAVIEAEDREIILRHLPILGRKTLIRLRPKRYQCLYCHGNPTTTQTLSWHTPRSSFTKAYEKQILLSLVNSTVQDISIKEDIGYEAIMGIMDRYIERAINWADVPRLDGLGLD